MEVIGLNFTKISAERMPQVVQETTINSNVEFTECTKETLDFLKDKDGIRISFRFTISYAPREAKETKKEGKNGEVLFEGQLLLAAEKETAKEIWKSWKKKEIPITIKVPLFNLILKKCTAKALDFEDLVGLPAHIPLPQLTPKPQNQ